MHQTPKHKITWGGTVKKSDKKVFFSASLSYIPFTVIFGNRYKSIVPRIAADLLLGNGRDYNVYKSNEVCSTNKEYRSKNWFIKIINLKIYSEQ